MSGFLLDTNVISEVIRPNPNPSVLAWVRQIDESLLFLSVLTLGEIRKGISLLPSNARRSFLEAWIESDLLTRFADRILGIDLGIAQRWGSISASSRSHGLQLPVIDGLLAATAMHHNLTLVSRDEIFSSIRGLDSVNPWQG